MIFFCELFCNGYIKPRMENWVLLVIVIVIIYLYASGKYKNLFSLGTTPSGNPTQNVSMSQSQSTDNSSSTTPTEEPTKESLEQQLVVDGIMGANAEACSADTPYAVNDFGLPGIQFSEWAMYQTVDPRTIASNKQYAEDRLGSPQTWTGATYSPDRHDTYDAVPWQGLARPARVAVASPDQIPDLDTSRYPATKRFRWNSNEQE